MNYQQQIDQLIDRALEIEENEGANAKSVSILRRACQLQDQMDLENGNHICQNFDYETYGAEVISVSFDHSNWNK